MGMTPYRVQIPQIRSPMWGGVVIWVFAGYFLNVARGVTPASLAVYLSIAAAASLLTYRMQRAELVASAGGVEVKKVVGDVMVAWDDIAEFERGPSFFGPVVQIRLVSGRTVRAVSGTAAGSPIGGEPSLRFQVRAIGRLNELLAKRRCDPDE